MQTNLSTGLASGEPGSVAAEKTAPRVLIVEDEGIIAGHIASRLARTGYDVAGIAESSEEALQKIDELQPELVLMDIRIKGSMDGVETTAKMRERHDIPVIFLTAHTDQQTIDRAKVTGAFGFLTKPIHHTSLATAIEMAIHKHRADKAWREQRAWLATALGAMASAMIVVDRDGRVQFLNAPAEQLTGFSNAEAQQKNIGDILAIEDPASGADRSEMLLPTPGSRSTIQFPRGVFAIQRSGKTFPIDGEVAPSMDGNIAVGAVITFRDATARLAEENEVRHQQKMQAVGRLAAGIAHDFNNLLFLILGYTEEMLRDPALKETEVHSLAEIKKAGETAATITQQLLKFSRKEPGQKRDIDLNEVIRETAELLRRAAGVSVKWEFKLGTSLGTIHGDPGQMKQVLMNLVSNARDAMPDGGTITVETSNIDSPVPGMRDGTDRFVAFSIADVGTGMTAETAEHLFEPFFTTKQPGSGTGLGLSIVHSIVTDHGGTIHVDSEPGKGATFTIYLPRVGASTPIAEQEAPVVESRNRTILLVEDNPDVRRLLRAYVDAPEFEILEADDGTAAIRVASEYPGTIDLLITDAAMPGASGFEVARWMSSHRKGTKILFVSGYAQELINGIESLPPGARFLPKPFMKRDLLKNVSDLLADTSTLSMKSGL